MRTPPPLEIHLRPPRRVLAAIVFSHLATAALIATLPLPTDVRLGGAAIVALICAGTLIRIGGGRAPQSLRLGLDRRITVRSRDATTRDGSIHPDSHVGARLTTIVWRPDGARRLRTLLILPDAIGADDFRRLRIVLRYGREPEAMSDVEAG